MNDETVPVPGPMPTPATLYVYWADSKDPTNEGGYNVSDSLADHYDPDYPNAQFVGVYQLVGMKKLKMVPAVVTAEDC